MYKAAILDSVTVENWGKEIFDKGVGVKQKKWARGEEEGKKKYACLQGLFICKLVHHMDGSSEWYSRLQAN